MDVSLYGENTPQHFWKILEGVDDSVWHDAFMMTMKQLNYPVDTLDAFLLWSLGEGSYGNEGWTLSFPKKVYYLLKPLIPQFLSKQMRCIQIKFANHTQREYEHWPIDSRYVDFVESIIKNVMNILGVTELSFIHWWKNGKRSAFVLTHDVECEQSQQYVMKLAKLEHAMGFRSCFHFVGDRYPICWDVIDGLKEMGFEIGIHGLKHDGKLFLSPQITRKRMQRINDCACSMDAAMFRAPMTIRDPFQMQMLDLPYDLSFFDTDPFEPMPGGVMSIWPFNIGHLIELPYTLVQDYTLFELLKQNDFLYWQKKVIYLMEHFGMILLDSHPDYLQSPHHFKVYQQFLESMCELQSEVWHALPSEVGAWWCDRIHADQVDPLLGQVKALVKKEGDGSLSITY